ncbi:DDX24 family protein [Megaselia abdita]
MKGKGGKIVNILNDEDLNWQKVKIKGPVISNDASGLEGLIGLEVLEDYNLQSVLKGGEKHKTPKQKRKEERLAKKELKKKSVKPVEVKAPEPPKKRKVEEFVEESANESEDDDPKKRRKKKQQQKKMKKISDFEKIENADSDTEDEGNEEAGRFVKPPPPEEDLVDMQEVTDGWNGLGVPEPILRALAEKGFNSPTEIQSLSLPAAILGKKDILGAAETGSGKTLAFGIPILTGIMELKRKNIRSGIRKPNKIAKKKNRDDRDLTPPPEELVEVPMENSDSEEEKQEEEEIKEDEDYKPLYAVVLTPTRELAVQVRDHIIAAAKYTGITAVAVFGGLAQQKQERILKKGPEIVVATPGRFWELLQQENAHLSKIDDISFLVIDETDRMVEKGHFEELKLLMRRINFDETRKQSRQNFIFSATLSMVHDIPDHLHKRNASRKNKIAKITPGMKIHSLIEDLGISQPKIVDVTRSTQTAQTLTECRLICSIEQKDYYLYYFIQRHPGRTIVFCNSIDCVRRLSTLFGLLDCHPMALHANMMQKQRLKNLERFTKDDNGLLIATDVAARGLDIPRVQHVIHYQVPRTSENYVHRSGRTARANQNGITVMFMDPGEVKSYLKLCKTLDRSECSFFYII